jgi:hypothetical protein
VSCRRRGTTEVPETGGRLALSIRIQAPARLAESPVAPLAGCGKTIFERFSDAHVSVITAFIMLYLLTFRPEPSFSAAC